MVPRTPWEPTIGADQQLRGPPNPAGRQWRPPRIEPAVFDHHRLAGGRRHPRRSATGADGEAFERGQKGCAEADGREAPQLRLDPLVGVIEQMQADAIDAEGFGHGGDDQRQGRDRLDLGQLFDQAVQAAKLAACRRVGFDPGDHGHDVVGVDLEGRHVGHDPPASQHGDPVGYAEDLLQAVGDHENARACRSQLIEQLLDGLGLGDAERRRRLVENQDRRVSQQRPGDGYQLTLPSGEGTDGEQRVGDRDVDAIEEGLGFGQHGSVVEEEPTAALAAEKQVGDGAQVVAQRQVLPDDRHALIAGSLGIGGERLAGDLDGARVGRIAAGHALDEGGFARAVLADEGDDLACSQVEVDAPEHPQGSETLLDAPDAEHGDRRLDRRRCSALHGAVNPRVHLDHSLRHGQPPRKLRLTCEFTPEPVSPRAARRWVQWGRMATRSEVSEVSDEIYAKRWWTLGTLCLALIVIGVDNTILNVALPSIVRDLNATGSQLQLMVDAYTIVFACLLLTAGSLGDRYGRRHALMFGLLWFGLFSGYASTVSSPTQLIIARGLMGVGGAFIYPTTLSILTNTFRDHNERSTAIGIWAGVSGIGIALGPLAGGLLVERFGWSSVFLVNLPICAIALAMSWTFVPNTSDPADSPLDPLGAVLSILGFLFFLYAIIEGPDRGWSSTVVMTGLAIGVALIALFAVWEWYNPAPMLDVRFFKDARFSAASATITLTFFGFYASTFLLTQYFQFILGYSPLKAGVFIIPTAVGLMIGSPIAPRLVSRFGTKRVVVFGLGLVAAAMACYGSNTIMSNVGLGLFVRLMTGLGFGFASVPVTESIMGSLPPSRAGVGSAVNDTTRQTGGALGVAVIGSIFAARYHAAIGDLAFLPPGSRAAAQESIGTSLQTAATIGGAAGKRLVHVANEAYLSSMRVTYAIAVGVIGVAMIVAYRYLPAEATVRPVDASPRTADGAVDGVHLDLGLDHLGDGA